MFAATARFCDWMARALPPELGAERRALGRVAGAARLAGHAWGNFMPPTTTALPAATDTESALLAAVDADPAGLLPRLVLADRLSEQGRGAEAEGWWVLAAAGRVPFDYQFDAYPEYRGWGWFGASEFAGASIGWGFFRDQSGDDPLYHGFPTPSAALAAAARRWAEMGDGRRADCRRELERLADGG